MMLTVFSLSLLFGVAVGDIEKCPDLKPIDDFDLAKMAATNVWYQVDAFYYRYDTSRKCIRYTAKMAEGDSTKVIGFEKYRRYGTDFKNYYTITTPNASEPGKVELTIENEKPLKALVLYADYGDYIVSYSCSNQHFYDYTQDIWVLAKENTLDDHKRLEIYDKIKSLGIKGKLEEIDHKNCPED